MNSAGRWVAELFSCGGILVLLRNGGECREMGVGSLMLWGEGVGGRRGLVR